MENKFSWTPVHKVVHQAIIDHEDDIRNKVYGESLVNRIVRMLKNAGFINEY